MGVIGKIIGGTIGLAIGGPLGAIAGAALGHAYDSGRGQELAVGGRPGISNGEQDQVTFFVAAFSMLAKLANADGHVATEEIDSINRFMAQDLNLTPESRTIAMNVFETALQSPETFDSFAHQFYSRFQNQPRLLEVMLDILLRVAVADKVLSAEEESMILSAVRIFRFSNDRYLQMKHRYINDVDQYYSILGCNRSDSDAEIKKRFRHLAIEYHPDKIASKGLPEEFNAFANEKFQEINNAYGAIKKERGMK